MVPNVGPVANRVLHITCPWVSRDQSFTVLCLEFENEFQLGRGECHGTELKRDWLTDLWRSG
ncbi:hypothetical protein DPMN_065378 [Dreissena polymorpha]|uniref:Uncharacterized protein n=1 Tax=Dreissena polymorpha TaxID=45954 RepID=A0A9D3YUJ3_DREPO|nr:hypothetical protein DPMN_065378 [Dreissena polymorpha]